MSKFGNTLRDRREMAGLTQEDLAGRLGVSRATISRWELGTDLPAAANLDDIARFMRIPYRDLNWLIEGRKPDPGAAVIETRIADLEQRMAEVVTILNGLFDHVSYDSQRVSFSVAGRAVRIDGASGTVSIEDQNGNEIKLDTAGIHITAAGRVNISASTFDLDASLIDTQSGMTNLHGIAKCDTLIATNVIANNYSPGAGNIW